MSHFFGFIAVVACVCLAKSALGCDDQEGIHCIDQAWNCPNYIFKEEVPYKDIQCEKHCCRLNGEVVKAAYAVKEGATLLINPGHAAEGYCQLCPGGPGNNFRCCDQRDLSLPAPLSKCKDFASRGCVSSGTPQF